MRIGGSVDAFCEALRRVLEPVGPFALPPLVLRPLDGFLALQPAVGCAPLDALAAHCVRALDDWRLPHGAEEERRRNTPAMSAVERENLYRWGYPYVFAQWRFHMTLTGCNPPAAVVLAAEAAFSAGILAWPRVVNGLAVFVEAEPGAPFVLWQRISFGGAR